MTIRVGPSRPAKIIAECAKSVKSRTSFRRIDGVLDRGTSGRYLVCTRPENRNRGKKMTPSFPSLHEGSSAPLAFPRPILSRVGTGLMGLLHG